jgi:hypothetical protein
MIATSSLFLTSCTKEQCLTITYPFSVVGKTIGKLAGKCCKTVVGSKKKTTNNVAAKEETNSCSSETPINEIN